MTDQQDLRARISVIEDEIAAGKHTASSVFTKVRPLLREAEAQLGRVDEPVPDGWVLVRKEAIDWLNGESDFECPPDRYFRGQPPRYWWRSVFREKAGLCGGAQARQQGIEMSFAEAIISLIAYVAISFPLFGGSMYGSPLTWWRKK